MPEILKISPEKPEAALIAKAVKTLKTGGVIAYPTETFYGLGVDGSNELAIEKIFRIKGRNFRNPISIIIGDKNDLSPLVEEISEHSRTLLQHFWPGPLTIVFAASSNVSPLLTAGTGKIGIRVSSDPIATALAKALSHPITATSANRSGETECTTAAAVIQCIGHDIDMVIDGGTTPGIAGSTIIDVVAFPPVILREGIIPTSLIHSFL
ncbi:MAG: L-threonylcarbamoyladenylate synthase [Deltaproteobacteria bacterium]|nr:L-threonylcarbamoyladenylate synthase [Deltaproteobacteria bacterium]